LSRNGLHIIDCHQHVGSVTSLNGGADTGPPAAPSPADDSAEVASRLETMAGNGIDQAIVTPTHDYLRPDGSADTARLNDAIARYRDRDPGHFVAALGIAEPLHGDRSIAELERMRFELGMAGVSFHTKFQGVPNDSPWVTALIIRAARLGLVPFVHCHAENPEEDPWRVIDAARAVPDTPVVILDGFSGFTRAGDISRAAAETPNLVFDTALVFSFSFVERFIDRFGVARVLFGTDLYSSPHGFRRCYTLDQLFESSLDAQEQGQLLSGNIRRVLSLKDATQ
jgi:predicted TIM-barrel fold metal-dependent hydrolase